MSAHTPGPWRVEGVDSGDHFTRPARRILRDVEYVPGVPPTTFLIGQVSYPSTAIGTVGAEERLANAHLIASAPDLLEHIRVMMSVHCPQPGPECGVCEHARALISRAEGRQP